MKLQVSPILKYIAEGEHQRQDFKFCINDSRKIARTLVAFANTDGGRLLIGVKDNGRIAGVRSDEEYYMIEAAARLYCKPAMTFEPVVWDIDGKIVLEVSVSPGDEKPYLAQTDDGKWLAYIRVGDENILANAVLVKSWKLNNNPRGLFFNIDTPRRILVELIKSETQPISLTKFVKTAHISRKTAQDILAEFIALKCIRITFTNDNFYYEKDPTFNTDSILNEK